MIYEEDHCEYSKQTYNKETYRTVNKIAGSNNIEAKKFVERLLCLDL